MTFLNALLLLLWFSLAIDADDLSSRQKCWFRCTAVCLKNDTSLNKVNCLDHCKKYADTNLCGIDDLSCWDDCFDLEPQQSVNVTTGFRVVQQNMQLMVTFNSVPDAVFYVVQYKTRNRTDFNEDDFEIVLQPEFSYVDKEQTIFCDPIDIRVSAVTATGTSPFSELFVVDSPHPFVDPKLQLINMTYSETRFVSEFYSANSSIEITFQFSTGAWPLGPSDLDVSPMFHMVTCIEPDLSQGVPLPEFVKGTSPNTLVGRLGSDMMHRDCRFVYFAQTISSRQCGTYTEVRTPPSSALQTLIINCDTVQDSPCQEIPYHPAPVCGQIEDMNYTVISKVFNPDDKEYTLTLNVTFEPINRNEPPTIYYKAMYGDAIPYHRKEEEALIGVNITNITGTTTNCLVFDDNGFCLENTGNSLNVSSIRFDKLYGITFCAVKDPKNLDIPNITATNDMIKPRSHKIFIQSRDKSADKTIMIIGIVVGSVALLVFGIIGICCYINKKQKHENKLYQLKLAQLEREKQSRYTDLPKKHDIWEIERRNLIIFEKERLGCGAFGSVYLGKLLGQSIVHKDISSPLSVNLMRAESCQVAVKMLPEYADDLSRGDFLREIGLMKLLGYHERLVNMLACITESEPLCLVMEYCSDGDLLRFLRERCKYMIKLDADGINYHEPPVDNNYDIDMVITLKQLLMFAVQVSYGLEYLSSKGFVHRDVAARNVLVHGKNACKIGDFGLCRNLYTDNSLYKSKGGRLPLKWMSPEAIRHYEFSAQSDVWAFGVLLFEIITLGGSPYPSVPPENMLPFLENGGRMEQPDNCPENFYEVMCECWTRDPEKRPDFLSIRQKLAAQLEEITEEYSYLTLDARKDYYNVQYGDQKPDVIVIPEIEPITQALKEPLSEASTLSIDSLPVDDVTTERKSDVVVEATKSRSGTDPVNYKYGGFDNGAYRADKSL